MKADEIAFGIVATLMVGILIFVIIATIGLRRELRDKKGLVTTTCLVNEISVQFESNNGFVAVWNVTLRYFTSTTSTLIRETKFKTAEKALERLDDFPVNSTPKCYYSFAILPRWKPLSNLYTILAIVGWSLFAISWLPLMAFTTYNASRAICCPPPSASNSYASKATDTNQPAADSESPTPTEATDKPKRKKRKRKKPAAQDDNVEPDDNAPNTDLSLDLDDPGAGVVV